MKSIFRSLIFLVFIACSKDEDPLPAATKTGANTFGCYVDGKPWVPDGKNDVFNKVKAIQAGYVDPDGEPGQQDNLFFQLTMSNGDLIHLYVRNCNQPGTYFFNQNTNYLFNASFPKHNYGLYFSSKQGVFISDSLRIGSIRFTRVEPKKGLLSGTFEFNAYSSHFNRVVKVTSGRFDIDILKLNR